MTDSYAMFVEFPGEKHGRLVVSDYRSATNLLVAATDTKACKGMDRSQTTDTKACNIWDTSVRHIISKNAKKYIYIRKTPNIYRYLF